MFECGQTAYCSAGPITRPFLGHALLRSLFSLASTPNSICLTVSESDSEMAPRRGQIEGMSDTQIGDLAAGNQTPF